MNACLLRFFLQGDRTSFYTCEVPQPDVDDFAADWEEIAPLATDVLPRVVPSTVLKPVQGKQYVRVRAQDVIKQATNNDTPVRVCIVLYVDDDLYPPVS